MSKFKLVSDLKSEFRKISWLSKSDLLQQTRIVLVSILLVGFLVYVVDALVHANLTLITSVLKMIMR